jgi:hypothetical protein
MVSGNFTSCHRIYYYGSTQLLLINNLDINNPGTQIHGLTIDFVSLDPEPFGLFSSDRSIAEAFLGPP